MCTFLLFATSIAQSYHGLPFMTCTSRLVHDSRARSFIMNDDPANDVESTVVNAQSEDEVTKIMKRYNERRRAAEDHLIASLASA